MKSPYVNELEPNQVVKTSFLVHSKEIRQKKSGEFYLSLLLGGPHRRARRQDVGQRRRECSTTSTATTSSRSKD